MSCMSLLALGPEHVTSANGHNKPRQMMLDAVG